MKILKTGKIDEQGRTGLGKNVLKAIGGSKGDFAKFVFDEKTGKVFVEAIPLEKVSK
jgi:hypothetical protein